MSKYAVVTLLIPVDNDTIEIPDYWIKDIPENCNIAADIVELEKADDVYAVLQGTFTAHVRKIKQDGFPV